MATTLATGRSSTIKKEKGEVKMEMLHRMDIFYFIFPCDTCDTVLVFTLHNELRATRRDVDIDKGRSLDKA